jgi:hypothetical protein
MSIGCVGAGGLRGTSDEGSFGGFGSSGDANTADGLVGGASRTGAPAAAPIRLAAGRSIS